MSSAFPLFNSPYVVISEVFNMLEFHELITLSLCSQNTKSMIKLNWRKPENRKVSMNRTRFRSSVAFNYETISDDLLEVMRKTNKLNLKNQETVEVDGYKCPIAIHKDGHSILFFDDKKLGMRTATEYVCDVFNTQINELYIGRIGLWAIEWINDSQKKPLPIVCISRLDTLSEEEYFKVLTQCKVTDELAIHASAPKSFRFDSNIPKVDSFKVTQGQWMTIDNLISMDCKAIEIERTKFTSSEINRFVTNWVHFGCPQLEYFHINTEYSINCFDVLAGLEYFRFDESQVYTVRDGRQFSFKYSYIVKRSDGVTASINGQRGYIAMFVQHDKTN